MAISERELTLEEFLALPERKPALEYIDGRVTQKVSPRGRHSVLQGAGFGFFNGYGRPQRMAMAFPELRVTFAGESRVPDLAVFRWERIPVSDTGEVADEFFEPPDIVVEIVSPKQSVNGLIRRCVWYVEHGVQAALLVDPADKSISLFRPGRNMVVLRGPEPVDLDAILPGLQLTAQQLFDSLSMR
jgi:Uma2 family endonuclease